MVVEDAVRFLNYNYWANERVIRAVFDAQAQHDEDIQRLFSHLLRAQEVWLGRAQGEDTTGSDLWPHYAPDSWLDRAAQNRDAWADNLSTVRELGMPIQYTNSQGASFTTALTDITTHLTIHGQHHRAQIARRLREVGTAPPASDYIYYVRAMERADI